MTPLVPPHVDLRGMPFMPLDVNRLRDSSLAIRASGDEFRAAVLLWCASWNQLPAASLPADESDLCFFVGLGRDLKAWRRLRARAMHGWVLCDDGRWYHPVVAEKALEAWDQRVEYQERQRNELDRKGRERAWRSAAFAALRGIGVHLSYDTKTGALRDMVREHGLDDTVTSHATGHALVTVTGHALVTVTGHAQVTAKTGTGTGTGTGIKDQEHVIDAGADSSAGDQRSEPDPPTDPPPTEAGRTCLLLRGLGLPVTNPSHAELVALLADGATPEEIADTARELRDAGRPLDARTFGYVLATVKHRRADAKSRPQSGQRTTAQARGSPTDPRSALPPPGAYKAHETPFDASIPGSF